MEREREGEGGGGGEGYNKCTVRLRFVSQLTISSYRYKIRTLLFFYRAT